MRIIVVSDTHGRADLLQAAVRHAGKTDVLLHLGDGQRDCDMLSGSYIGAIWLVKGNCDFAFDGQYEHLLHLDGVTLYMTHGHLFEVKSTLNKLWYKGIETGADIICFGHTHIPLLDKQGEVTLLNPGSLKGGKTYALIEIRDGKADVQMKSLDR
jgi:uncharacterized protein